MSTFRALFLLIILWSAALGPATKPAVTQEITLVPLDSREVAKGYSANALKQRSVVNDKLEPIGRISDFMFAKDGYVFAIIAVGDSGGNTHLVAVPFKGMKLDDRGGNVILPGATLAALQKLPVFFYDR